MWTYLAAAQVMEILNAQHAAILEYVANLKEREKSFGGYAGLDGIAEDGQEATAPATVDSMEPVHHAAREEPTSTKAMPEGRSASLPLVSLWLDVT